MRAAKPQITLEDAIASDVLTTPASVEQWQRQQLIARRQRADEGHFVSHDRAEEIASRFLKDD